MEKRWQQIHRRPRTGAGTLALLFIWWIWAAGGLAKSAPSPLPEVGIQAVADLGTIAPPPGIQGRDGGYSALFKGRSVWIYGDTLLAGNGPAMVSNSWSRTDDLVADDGIDGFQAPRGPSGTPGALFPFTLKERAFNRDHQAENCATPPCGARWGLWPGALVADPARGRMLVFYQKVLVQPGFLAFQTAGHGVAVWRNIEAAAKRPVGDRSKKHPTLMFDAGEPGFGSAAVTVGPRLYVFGCDRQGAAKPCRLARVPLGRVLDKTAWRYYGANGRWCKAIGEGAPVFAGNSIMSVSYNLYLDRYLAVYSRPLGTGVMFRTAAAPEGPWSAPLHAFDALAPENETGWVYDALEHPEYAQGGGSRIFITYSRQTGPESFEQRLVSVRLNRIAP